MATDLERLVVQLSADIKGYENAMRRAQGITGRQTRAIERQFQRSNANVAAGFAGLARGIAAAFAGGTALAGAQRLIDAATRIQNALRVAGLEGDQLSRVYDSLFASAQRNAAPLEALVTLYGRAALQQRELGVSTEELLRFTDNVALALRVAGSDAQSASGALLQLSQALGSGVVRAEEFNSILEGAPTIAQAVAAGLKEAGGSVAELRKLVIDGKVSSEAFFRAFEAGAPMLQQKVAGAQATIGQAMQRLQNSLVDAAGKFDEVSGASRGAIKALDSIARTVEALSHVFEAAANGPIGKYLAMLERIAGLIQMVDPVSRGVDLLASGNAATLLDKAAGVLGPSRGPVATRVAGGKGGRVAPDPIQSRIDAAFGDTEVRPVSLSDFKSPAGSGKGKAKRESDFARETRQIRERTEALRAETAAQAKVNPLVDDYGFAVEQAAARHELLTAAQRSGLAITPELTAKIEALATGYATASVEAQKLAESQDRARQVAEDLADAGKQAFRSFIDDLIDGKSAADALATSLGNIGDRLLDMALDMAFGSITKGLGGLLGGGARIGLFHTGGVAGRAQEYRNVHPAIFSGAQRYHAGGVAGLKPGEVPAILQRGELVLPRGFASKPTASAAPAVYNIDARGAQAGVAEQITDALKAYDKGRLGRLAGDLPELRKRGALR